jgi:hypothetical protein
MSMVIVIGILLLFSLKWGPLFVSSCHWPAADTFYLFLGICTHTCTSLPLPTPSQNPNPPALPHQTCADVQVKETRKIWGEDGVRITATCIRVPVMRAHAESINLEFSRDISGEWEGIRAGRGQLVPPPLCWVFV